MSEQVNPVELQLDEQIRERYLGEMQVSAARCSFRSSV
jgi:hypothetical protein